MSQLDDSINQFTADANIVHEITHGDSTTTVETESGPVRSVAKLIADNQALIDAALPNFNIIANGTSPDAGTLTGAETIPVSRGAGLLQTTWNTVATFIVTMFTIAFAVGIGAVARTLIAWIRDQPVTVNGYYNPAVESWVMGLKRAIAAMNAIGGGIVRIPSGVWPIQATDMTQDPTPNTSNFRWMTNWSGVANVGVVGDGDGTVLFLAAGLINSDSANQYCKGYQLFWSGSQAAGYAAANNIWFDDFKVDGNFANNQIAPVNSYGNQAQGAVFCFSNGNSYRVGDGVWIEGATGHQPVAFYRGTTGLKIGRMRFTNCGQTSGTNSNLSDHSSIYNEGDHYEIDQPSFWGPSPDLVSTAIECHGNYGQITVGRIDNYKVGVIRAAMVSNSVAVSVRGGVFYNCVTVLQPDAAAGMSLDIEMLDPLIYMRPKSLSGSLTPAIVNTSSQFAAITNQTGNYTRLAFKGARCFSATGAGVKAYIGGFVNELYWEDNYLNGFDYNYEIGHHAQGGQAYFRRNTYENMSGVLLNWAQYSAAADAINGSGTPPTTMHVEVSGETFTESTSFSAVFQSNQVTNPIINDIDLSRNKALTYAPQPFVGNWTIVCNSFVVHDYIVNGVTNRLFASFPPMDVKIRDIGNACDFFKHAGDTYLWALRRGATAPVTGSVGGAFLGTDYAGDIYDIEQPTNLANARYMCTGQSPSAGVAGTWNSIGTAANTWAGSQTFSNTLVGNGLIAANANVRVNAATPAYRALVFTTNGIARFDLAVGNTAETGLNAGSNQSSSAYGDAGTLLGPIWNVLRSTQVMTFAQPIQNATFTVATLPSVASAGQSCYASNGRKPGEGAGSGTGVTVVYTNGAWMVQGTFVTVTS